MTWLAKLFPKKEAIPEVHDTQGIPDYLWVENGPHGYEISRNQNDGLSFLKTEIHKQEVKKRIALARTPKPLRWEVRNNTYKTFTAKTGSKYYQIFATGPTTCNFLISTHKVSDPISDPLRNQFVYRNETIKNTSIGQVMDLAANIHKQEIVSELNEDI